MTTFYWYQMWSSYTGLTILLHFLMENLGKMFCTTKKLKNNTSFYISDIEILLHINHVDKFLNNVSH